MLARVKARTIAGPLQGLKGRGLVLGLIMRAAPG